MDITNQCNLRCVMCYFSDSSVAARPRRDLSVDEFRGIADQVFLRAQRVSLSVGTEPLLHHEFGEIATIAGRYGVPTLYLNTSAVLLSARHAERLIACGFRALGISMDGATATTYERIRVGARFDRVVSNIRELNRLKRKFRSETPVVTMNFVMMRSNVHELPAFLDLAHALEVPNVNAIHLVPYARLGNERESLVHDKALCNRMLEEARVRARRHGMTFCEPGNFDADAGLIPVDRLRRSSARGHAIHVEASEPAERCPFPWHFVAIDADGTVRPCGWWHNEPPVGNILREPFEHIWNGEGYRRLRMDHVDGRLRTVCRQCPAGGLGSVDDELAFAAR